MHVRIIPLAERSVAAPPLAAVQGAQRSAVFYAKVRALFNQNDTTSGSAFWQALILLTYSTGPGPS